MSDMNYDTVLIRYGELSLKNNNRADFERQLVENIRSTTAPFEAGSVHRLEGAIRLNLTSDSQTERILEQLERTPGIAWFAPCWTVDRNVETIGELALEKGEERIDGAETFAVDTQRSDKEFPKNSMEINTEIGTIVDDETDLNVDLESPDWTVHLHLLHDDAYLFFERREGLQGLPVGSTGDVLVQLSGGIDSPVASVEMMKRGCRADYIHFYPYADPEQALDKLMGSLIERLGAFSTGGTLHLAPYYPFELGMSGAPQEYEMVLFRRHALRVSERIAERDGHGAIVTGESLGQVASQTMENIRSIADGISTPVFRPLIGMNKNEIIGKAKRYGTYELSISDYKDCCSIQSSHPRTTSDPAKLRRIEEENDLRDIDESVLEEITSIEFSTHERSPAVGTVA